MSVADEIYEILKNHPDGLTAAEIGKLIGRRGSDVMKRINTLYKWKMIDKNGTRYNPHGGYDAVVWKVTE